jgi:hypothetical protein
MTGQRQPAVALPAQLREADQEVERWARKTKGACDLPRASRRPQIGLSHRQSRAVIVGIEGRQM